MAIDGHRSDFPGALDDWGAAFENNVCQRFRAEPFNRIQDALLQLERHTRRILITGTSNGLRTDPGADRPRMLVKCFAVTLTGSNAEYKTANLPAFTTAEKALFDGEPLAPENSVHLYCRKVRANADESRAYVAALKSPIVPDGTAQVLTLAPLRDAAGENNLTVGAGTYLVTLLITR